MYPDSSWTRRMSITEASLVPSERTIPAYTPRSSASENPGAGLGCRRQNTRPATTATPAATKTSMRRRDGRSALSGPRIKISGPRCGDAVTVEY